MILGLPDAVRGTYRADSVTKLLISSAPARKETKLAIMEHFRNARLLEGYGSTEAGWVTLLRPEEQLSKLGSIGRELTGCGRIKLLDDDGEEVADGEVGELYSRTPYAFRGYWKLPEKTAEAFRGPYCSVGDMARRDEEGYYYLADRKSNMIISGGENVYPSEVESLLGSHPEGERRRGHRRPGRHMGRSGPRRGGAARRAARDRGRAARVVPDQDRRLQAPEVGRVHPGGGDAPHRHRQDSASGAEGAIRHSTTAPGHRFRVERAG